MGGLSWNDICAFDPNTSCEPWSEDRYLSFTVRVISVHQILHWRITSSNSCYWSIWYRKTPCWTLQGRVPTLCQHLLVDHCGACSDIWWYPWRLINRLLVSVFLFLDVLCLHLVTTCCFAAAVLGTAFAFNILLKIPVWAGVILTVFSTLLLLGVQRFGVHNTLLFNGYLHGHHNIHTGIAF